MRGLVDSQMDEREEGRESVGGMVDMLTDEGRVCEVGAGVAQTRSDLLLSQRDGRALTCVSEERLGEKRER